MTTLPFTPAARLTCAAATEIATRLDERTVAPEHLLLGLFADRDGLAVRALRIMGIDRSAVERALTEIADFPMQMELGDCDRDASDAFAPFSALLRSIGAAGEAEPDGPDEPADVPLLEHPTPATALVLRAAGRIATRMGHCYIGTEHLLLAIIREASGICAGAIERLNVSTERVEVAIEELLAASGSRDLQAPRTAGAEAADQAVAAESSGDEPGAPGSLETADLPVAPAIPPRRGTNGPAIGLVRGIAKASSLDRPAVTFADVAGLDEAKLELRELVDFLRDPARFARMGARSPRGAVLYGPPGTGKTLLAKAVAGEAGVPFLARSGSDFVEVYVGKGAQRVRELFAKARKNKSAVIFIDEIDALASGRSDSGAGGDREHDQTVNALLAELDGFDTTDNIVVIAATNRLDKIDPAIVRPGRLGRRVYVPLPTLDARRAILGVHGSNKLLAPAVDLDTIARQTFGFSGAQLADLLNEAAILAVRRDGDAIDAADVRAAYLKVTIGSSLRNTLEPSQRVVIAAHEAGHAICGWAHVSDQRLTEISLFVHGDALGVTLSAPTREVGLPRESELRAKLVRAMGGRVAELAVFGEATSGAASDLAQLNEIAFAMTTRYGLGFDQESVADGWAYFVGDHVPEEVQAVRTRALRALFTEAERQARETLEAHRAVFEQAGAHLFWFERASGDELREIFEGSRSAPNEALAAWQCAVDAATRGVLLEPSFVSTAAEAEAISAKDGTEPEAAA